MGGLKRVRLVKPRDNAQAGAELKPPNLPGGVRSQIGVRRSEFTRSRACSRLCASARGECPKGG